MKQLFFLLLIGFMGFSAMAQENKAKTILDKVSAKNKEYKSIKAEFTFSMDNQEEDIHEVSEGSILLEGNKYKLQLMGVNTYFDGETLYTHILDAEEVNISEPDEDDDESLNPAKIFSIYESGFTYKYVREENIGNQKFHIIDLFPIDDDKSFSSIRLKINQNTNQIASLKSIGIDGNDVSIVLKKLTSNPSLSPQDFVFDVNAHPDVEVNDMR